jgi:hypothetical protein
VEKEFGYLVETKTNLLTSSWLHYQHKVSASQLQQAPMLNPGSWWLEMEQLKDSLVLIQLPLVSTNLICSMQHARSMETLLDKKSTKLLQQEKMVFH